MFNIIGSTRAWMVMFASVASFSFAGTASATGAFDAGIPSGWTCSGNCGTLGANGVVTTSPEGGQYGYVSSSGGISGNNGGFGGTNGSILTSSVFSANAGDHLTFYFNYVTSDGAGYADYAWSQLTDSASNVVSLFTARTTPSGNSVPGFGMPTINATINPATVVITPGGPAWSPLGGNSGGCYSTGCGYTGWVQADYIIALAGDYTLTFGVANFTDQVWDSGLAFDGVTVGGKSIDVPEPGSMALAGLGLLGIFAARRKHSA